MQFPIKEIGAEKYISLEKYWVYHKRGTNYIAHIKGQNRKYKYDRDFLETTVIANNHYYPIKDFAVAECYQFNFAYSTGGGKETEYLQGFFQVAMIEDDTLHLEKLTEEELIKELHTKKEIQGTPKYRPTSL